MENKKRLIDANKLKEKAEPEEVTGEGIVYVQDIDEAPTVDAVEVVRCKDCRWYNPKGGVAGQKTIICSYQPKDFFCAYGERKDK